MAAIAVLSVAAAISRDAPGVLVLCFCSIVPALIVTEVKARSRRTRGEPMPGFEQVIWFIFLSIVIPIPILIIMGLFPSLLSEPRF